MLQVRQVKHAFANHVELSSGERQSHLCGVAHRMCGEWVRVELSLRPAKKGGAAASAAAAAASVAEIPLGAVLPGVVRRVEAFGVFVEVPPPLPTLHPALECFCSAQSLNRNVQAELVRW